MRSSLIVAMFGVLVGASLAKPALAEAPFSVDLRGWTPPAAPNGGMYFEPAASESSFDFSAAMWTNYSHRPLRLRGPDEGGEQFDVIAHRVTSDFVFEFGLAERVTFGAGLGVLLYQTGDELSSDARTVIGQGSVPRHGLGDLGLTAKVTLVKPTLADLGGFALALHERFTLPTGDEASLMAEGGWTSNTRLLAEYRYLALSVHAALGFKARQEEASVACANVSSEACVSRFGHEIPFGLSLVFLPRAIGLDDKGRWTWFVETFGHVPVSPSKPFSNGHASQLQLGTGLRFAPGADLSIVGGVDTALVGGVGNPMVRGTFALSWAPRAHDRDGDGVRDEVDQCPEKLKEDHDGFEDADGCPDWDNDGDGIGDEEDSCVDEPEDMDGFKDDDGCPDRDNDADGILDGEDACPMQPGGASELPRLNGCPNPDPDGDGVMKTADRCPNDAEDRDGFEDEDGCPDPDNDGDGVNDAEDACPNGETEPPNETADAKNDESPAEESSGAKKDAPASKPSEPKKAVPPTDGDKARPRGC